MSTYGLCQIDIRLVMMKGMVSALVQRTDEFDELKALADTILGDVKNLLFGV